MPNPTNQDFDLLISELAKADERHGDSPGTADGSTIHDLKAELDTLELELRAASPIDQYEKEQECQRAVQIVEQLYREVQPHLETIIDEQTICAWEKIGPYQLVSKLGAGGMGEVYKAIHTKLKRVVAVKVLRADRVRDASAVARFEREMEAVGRLQHPNIVTAHDAGEADSVHYLVMEYVDGIDLSKLVRRVGPLDAPEACEIVHQCALALQKAHENNMVHRDVKPSNLMLSKDQHGERTVVKVLDLGLARLANEGQDRELTSKGQVMGTLNYMAPEQGDDSHEVDIRADIYSLGATLFELLSGKPPFTGENYNTPIKVLTAKLSDSYPSVSAFRADLPEEVVDIVDRMMAKNPIDRFATPRDVADEVMPLAKNADLGRLLTKASSPNGGPAEFGVLASTKAGTSGAEEIKTLGRNHASTTKDPKREQRQTLEIGRFLGNRIAVVATALSAFVILGIVFSIKTSYGEITVKLGDGVGADDVQVEVEQNGNVHLIDKSDNWSVDLADGVWNVRLKGGDDRFELDKSSVTIRRSGNELVTVSLKTSDDKREGRNPENAAANADQIVTDWLRTLTHKRFRVTGVDITTGEVRDWTTDHPQIPGNADLPRGGVLMSHLYVYHANPIGHQVVKALSELTNPVELDLEINVSDDFVREFSVGHLPSLRTLKIRSLEKQIVGETLGLLLKPAPKITQLELQNCVARGEVFFGPIADCSDLERLILDTGASCPAAGDFLLFASHPRIKKIGLRAPRYEAELLASLAECPITSLTLTGQHLFQCSFATQ